MTFDLFKKYVDEKYMRFNDGEIWFGKERIVFYYESYVARELALNSKLNGQRYMAIKFLASRKEGGELIRQHGATDIKELSSLLNACLKIMNILSKGTFKLVEADSGKGFAVVSGVSNIALETKGEEPSDSPIDAMIGGLLAGTMGYYTKKRAYSVELSCASQKDVGECVWVVGDREAIMDHVRGHSAEKAELAEKTLDQIEAAESELGKNEAIKDMI